MCISSVFLSETQKSRKDVLHFLISFANFGDMMHPGAWFDQPILR